MMNLQYSTLSLELTILWFSGTVGAKTRSAGSNEPRAISGGVRSFELIGGNEAFGKRLIGEMEDTVTGRSGRQARSKAKDSRSGATCSESLYEPSFPVGVRRFKSGPLLFSYFPKQDLFWAYSQNTTENL